MADGLIVKHFWLNKIFDRGKCWEVRGSRTNKRGLIQLIESGSGQIKGKANLTDCIKLTKELYEQNREKHQIPADYESLPYKQPYAWVLRDARRNEKPIPYKHPQGAVIWVKGLEESEVKRNELQTMEKEL